MSRGVAVRVLPGALVYHGEDEQGNPAAYVAGQTLEVAAAEAKALAEQGVVEQS